MTKIFNKNNLIYTQVESKNQSKNRTSSTRIHICKMAIKRALCTRKTIESYALLAILMSFVCDGLDEF